jgi:hypothetical protein
VGNTLPFCRIDVGTRKTLSMRRATRTSQHVQRQWDSLNSTMILMVIIEPTRPQELAWLRVAAYELSVRSGQS